jgi:hypothetical protein
VADEHLKPGIAAVFLNDRASGSNASLTSGLTSQMALINLFK